MFGGQSFGTQPTSTFGNFTSGANTTTASVFGQTQPTTSMPMFGSSTTAGGFNTPLKQTTFGTTFGSTPSNVVSPLFGSTQVNRIATAPATAGIFSQGTTSVAPFVQGQAQGTSIPFNPLTGSDTMMRNGQPSPINTKHQCITCMKDYENKSLEELRLEDYQLGRKGPAQNAMFGAGGAQQSTGIFTGLGSTATATGFGQQRNTTFGAPSTSSSLFTNLSQPKPASIFSNTNTGTTFGAPTFSFPATTTQQGGLLGFQNNNQTSTAATPFSFNQQPQTQMNLFNPKPLTAPATTTTTFAGFNNTLSKPLGMFASTASAPFGTTNTLGTSTAAPSLFSQNKPFQPFTGFAAQPTTQPFGQTSTSFSFPNTSTTTTSGVSFGATPATMFGSGTTSTGFGSFASNPTTISLGAPTTTSTAFPSFNFSNPQPSTGFSFFNNTSGTGTTSGTQVTPQPTGPVPFATTPYKDSPLFYNLITNRSLEEMTKPTNPLAQRAIKEASRRRNSSHLSSVTSPPSFGNLTFPITKNSVYNKQSSIFDGFEEDDRGAAVDILSPKSSVKRLSLKNVQGLSGLLYTSNPLMSASLSESHRFNDDRNSSNMLGGDYYLGSVPDDNCTIFRSPTNLHGENLLAGHLPHDFDNFRETHSGMNGPLKSNGTAGSKCGVVCERPGYYIQPGLAELDYLTQDDGSCFVEGFVVGRQNFGRIRFLQVVNVGGINLDEIVLFRHKETVVYPDDHWKPPVGEAINVPAEITMERVWPIDKDTREPIKSPVRVKSLNYEDKLRRSCKRMDAEFVSYDCDLGIWVFKVNHFSKYSCAPEENEDDENLAPVQTKGGLGGVSLEELKAASVPTSLTQITQMPESAYQFPAAKVTLKDSRYTLPGFPLRKIVPSSIFSEGQVGMEDSDTDDEIEFNPLTPSDYESDRNSAKDSESSFTVARKPSLYESVLAGRATSPKVGLMRSVLSLDEDEGTSLGAHPPSKKSRPPRPPETQGRKVRFSEVGSRKTKEDIDFTLAVQSPVDISGRRKSTPSTRLVCPSFRPDLTQMEFADVIHIDGDTKPYDLLRNLKLDDQGKKVGEDLFNKIMPSARIRQYRRRREIELIKVQRPISMFSPLTNDRFCVSSRATRGARVSFGRNGYFLSVLNIKNGSSAFNGKIDVLRLQPYSERLQEDGILSRRALKCQLEIQRESTDYLVEGKFEPCVVGNVVSHIETLNNFRRDTSTHEFSHDNMTPLGQEEQMWSLCKILWPPHQVADKFVCRFNRKFCYYQRKALSEWIILNGSSLFGKSLQTDSSVGGLLRQGLKLEACEKAVSDNNYTLALCLAQNSPKAKQTCDAQNLKWELCGAEKYISSELKELYQLCSGCPIWNGLNLRKMSSSDWFQHFAIYNWFLAPTNETVAQVVASYHNFIRLSIDPAAVGDNDLSFPDETEAEATIGNLCINLLKAYSVQGYPMKKLLSPRTNNPDSLDYKISWLLMNNLKRFGFTIDDDIYDTITNSFAGQLENLGCFEWAIFVLKHCKPSGELNILIKRILERNIWSSRDMSKENFIVSIGVDPTEICNAKSMKALKTKRNPLLIC